MTSTTITEPRVPLRARLRAWSSRRLDGAAGLVFWGWNGLFLLVTLVGLLPIHLASLLAAGLDGEVPLELALCTLALITLPVVASAAGLTSLRHRPRLLFGLFYGVEAPLFLVLLVRIFFLRELTIATGYVLVVASLAAVAFAVRIAEAHRADPWTRALAPSVRAGRFAAAPGTTPDSIASALLRLLAGVVCLAVGLWAGLLVAFWAVPAGAELAVAFFS
ncbi:hypothetical protein L6R52_41875, partial [Myxococcota bacterium]|nr:hypothetical protein [Myxococcota bacterium]